MFTMPVIAGIFPIRNFLVNFLEIKYHPVRSEKIPDFMNL